jgi:hypothetical protein
VSVAMIGRNNADQRRSPKVVGMTFAEQEIRTQRLKDPGGVQMQSTCALAVAKRVSWVAAKAALASCISTDGTYSTRCVELAFLHLTAPPIESAPKHALPLNRPSISTLEAYPDIPYQTPPSTILSSTPPF